MNKRSMRVEYLLAISDHLYRTLLHLYPRAFRHTFGPHMAQVFRDWCRQTHRDSGIAGLLGFWTVTAGDLAVTVFQERVAQWFQLLHLPRLVIVRTGGAAALSGGILYLCSTLFPPTGLIGLAVPGSIVCFVFGAVGLHVLIWGREGRAGRLGLVLMSVGLTLGLIGMTGAALGLAGSNPLGQPLATTAHAGLIFLGGGMLLWSGMILRLKALGRWSAVPLMIGLLSLTGIIFFNPVTASSVVGQRLLLAAPLAFAACWSLLGYALLRSPAEIASTIAQEIPEFAQH